MRFDSYHPFINLLFFAAVLGMSLAFNHPVFMGIAYASAFAYAVMMGGKKALAFNLILLPFMVAFTAVYAYNEHFGVTVLSQTVIDNQITLEALVYGATLSVRVATALMWLTCMLEVFTTDKVVYLFGRVAPRVSLFLAIVMRAVPVIRDRCGRVAVARSGLLRGPHQGSVPARVVNWAKRVSIIITWSIERFAETSESMQCRGSQLRGRTAYSLYRFDNRDRSLVLVLFFLLAVIAAGALLNQTAILYAPSFIFNKITRMSLVFYAAYAVFCLLPLGLQLAGEQCLRQSLETVE